MLRCGADVIFGGSVCADMFIFILEYKMEYIKQGACQSYFSSQAIFQVADFYGFYLFYAQMLWGNWPGRCMAMRQMPAIGAEEVAKLVLLYWNGECVRWGRSNECLDFPVRLRSLRICCYFCRVASLGRPAEGSSIMNTFLHLAPDGIERRQCTEAGGFRAQYACAHGQHQGTVVAGEIFFGFAEAALGADYQAQGLGRMMACPVGQ